MSKSTKFTFRNWNVEQNSSPQTGFDIKDWVIVQRGKSQESKSKYNTTCFSLNIVAILFQEENAIFYYWYTKWGEKCVILRTKLQLTFIPSFIYVLLHTCIPFSRKCCSLPLLIIFNNFVVFALFASPDWKCVLLKQLLVLGIDISHMDRDLENMEDFWAQEWAYAVLQIDLFFLTFSLS